MRVYTVPVTYEMCAKVDVHASTEREAFKRVEEMADKGEIPFGEVTDREYILGTMRVEWEECPDD